MTRNNGRAVILAAGLIAVGVAVANQPQATVQAASAKYATVTQKRYTMWGNLSWTKKWHSTSNWYHHSFKITKSVKKGSARYYQLSRKGKNFGYVNAKAVKTASGAQGAAIGANHYVALTKKGYSVWNSFAFKSQRHSSSNWLNRTFLVKTVYYHSNGSTYLSLYRNGKWFGYVNAGGSKSFSNTVYVTRTGKKYHFNAHCRGLSHAGKLTKLSLAKAKAKHYTLCNYE